MMLTRGFLFAFRELIGNIHKQDNYQNQSHGYLYIGSNFPEVTHFSNFLSSSIVRSKQTIPNKTEIVNEMNSGILLGKLTLGPIKAVANQAALRFINNPEKALRYGRNFFFFIKIILTPFKELPLGGKIK